MKLYNSVGPNPHVVRMFMAEKGIEMPMETVDIRGGENRREPYQSTVNHRGQCPALELDNGGHLCEVTAICEYLDEQSSGDSLIGANAEERGETRMWTRRVDLSICEPLGNGFRSSEGAKMFEGRVRLIPEGAEGMKATARDNLTWLNEDMGDKQFLCGDRLSLADILLFCFLEFGSHIGQKLDDSNTNLTAWFARMSERPSAKA
jgi:glutathione S-transferase